jgi:hypothetical protein
MVVAWMITVPAAALVAAATFELNDALGETGAGPVVVSFLALLIAAGLFTLAQPGTRPRSPVR